MPVAPAAGPPSGGPPGYVEPARARRLGEVVTGWGAAEGQGSSRRAELPWRATRDAWPVLVSEVMTQQTQVARVVPAYLGFLDAFPDPGACAAAPLGDVVRAWRGLGYNRRAVFLHRASQTLVRHHGGQVPATLPELLALPGVGPYTARAVLAFAFGKDVGVVDTNAGRVISRAVAGRRVGRREAQDLVDAMVPAGRGWEFGQALLDLGALVCTPAGPSCARCPIRRSCRWGRRGRRPPDPARGSAGVSVSQSRFDGSDRQGRGRLVDVLRHRPVPPSDIAASAGWPDDPARARRLADALVAEGMALRDRRGILRLP